MRAIVCGGRNLGRVNPGASDAKLEIARATAERKYFTDRIAELHAKHNFTEVIAGNEGGAERLGISWAERNGVRATQVERKPRETVPQRNARMLRDNRPDIVIAFGGGESTNALLVEAEKAGVPVDRNTVPAF